MEAECLLFSSGGTEEKRGLRIERNSFRVKNSAEKQLLIANGDLQKIEQLEELIEAYLTKYTSLR